MPNIKVVFWNIENFGQNNSRYGNSLRRCNLIAQAIANMDADIIMIQELQSASLAPLFRIQLALNNLPGQDWYCDWVKGSLAAGAAAPYATNADTAFTIRGRREGYAVIWRQNIARFIMQIADPVDPATVGMAAGAMVANTQSSSVSARDALLDLNTPGAGITVPAGAGAYSLPAGSTVGAGGIMRGGAVAVAAGVTGAVNALDAGDILPAGTIIGAGGMTLTALTQGVNPIVIPQGYTLPAAYTLPANGAVVVPQHALSLVLTGRPLAPNGFTNFAPGAVPAWGLLNFPDGIGALYVDPRNTRRPATCTIRVSTGGAAAAELIPITVYHAPLGGQAMAGMGRAANVRPLYQAYDHVAGAYINNTRAVIGGDFNQTLSQIAGHFTVFVYNFDDGLPVGFNGGAGCNTVGGIGAGGANNIRVNTPFPPGGLPAPVYPPLPLVPTAANNPVNKSLITLRQHFIGSPILSNNLSHFRSSPYDNIFYRGFTVLQSPSHAFGDLYFLPDAISGAAAPALPFYIPAALITDFQNLPVFNPAGGGGPVAPAAIGNVLNPATLLLDIQAGGFGNAWTAAGGVAATGVANPAAGAGPFVGPAPLPVIVTPQRRAAEFMRLFVTDHLPAILEMNL